MADLFPADATQLYQWLWACYDAGRAHERGERPLSETTDARAIVRIVARDWQLRMERYGPVERGPAWLTRLFDDDSGCAPWAD